MGFGCGAAPNTALLLGGVRFRQEVAALIGRSQRYLRSGPRPYKSGLRPGEFHSALFVATGAGRSECLSGSLLLEQHYRGVFVLAN